jgi:hypothetical protein
VTPAMRNCTIGRSQRVRCPARVSVHPAELLTSIADSDDVNLESGRLVCELAAGHNGRHVALAATGHGGDQWWWLHWIGESGETTELMQIDPCDAELPNGRYGDDCFLPGAHSGPHSFHLPPLPFATDGYHPVRPGRRTP